MKLLGWVHRKFRREAASGDPSQEPRLGNDGVYPYSQPSLLDELRSCCRLNHPRPSLHRPSFSNDGGCRQETSMDGHVLPQGLLAVGTLGLLDPSCLEGPPPPHLCFPFHSTFLAQKEQSASEAGEEDDTEQEGAHQPETGDVKNGNTSFSPGEVEAVGGGGEEGRENQGEKKERSTTLTGVVKKVLKRHGTKAGGRRENQDEKKERTLSGVVRKVLKQRGSEAGAVTGDCGSAAALPAGGSRESIPVEEYSKLYKFLKIFHKKVHPEGSIVRKEHKSSRFNTPVGTAYSSDGGGNDDEAIGISRKSTRKEGDFCHFRRWTRPLESESLESTSSCGAYSNGRGEHWIKTDRDYLVLEL